MSQATIGRRCGRIHPAGSTMVLPPMEVSPCPATPRRAPSPSPAPTIIPATDLGNVEVAKEGNLYLLTDPRGDIRMDGRGLGLYQLDTRILSTCDPASQRRAADPPARAVPRRRRRHDPADEPGAAPQPGRQADRDPEPRPSRAERDARTRRIEGVLRRAGDDRELLGDDRGASRSSSVWASTWPTSSRFAAIRDSPAARSARSRSTTIDSLFAYDGLDGMRRTTTVTPRAAHASSRSTIPRRGRARASSHAGARVSSRVAS